MISHSRAYVVVLIALFFLLPSASHAATLSLSPAAISVSNGDTVTETVSVTSTDQALNAISGELSFPEDLLQVVSVSKGSSILTLWVQDPSFSNTFGSVSWSGIVPNPGYIGGSRSVMSVQFRAKAAGTAAISFSSSAVLANNGNGTNILTATQPAVITIGAAQSSQPSLPPAALPKVTSQKLAAHIISSVSSSGTPQWYRLFHVVFDWTNDKEVTAILLGCDKDPNGEPTILYNDPISHKELDLESGTWYFHVQEKDANGWGPVSTYTLQLDANASSTSSTARTAPFSFFTIGWLAVNYLSILLVALAIFGILLFVIGYILVRFAAYRHKLKHRFNINDAQIHQEYTHFKDLIVEEMHALEKARLERSLTHDEERLIARFKKLLELSGHKGPKDSLIKKEEEILTRFKNALEQSEEAIKKEIQ